MTVSNFSDWTVVTGDGLDGFEEIVYEKRHHRTLGGGVARVSLNKPDKMNTLTLATVDEMFRAFYDANHDPMVGVIIGVVFTLMLFRQMMSARKEMG